MHSFTTFDVTVAKDLPVIIPEDQAAGFYSSTITISEDQRITDVNVFLDMTVYDVFVLNATLKSPNDTVVELFYDSCLTAASVQTSERESDIRAVFDDQAEAFRCGVEDSKPHISGRLKPKSDVLSRFNEQSTQGDWVLTIEDRGNTNIGVGTINHFGLQITTETGIEFENYPPLAFDQSVSADPGEEIGIRLNGSDPEGSALTYQISAADGQLSNRSLEKIGEWNNPPLSAGNNGVFDLVLFNEGKYAVAAGSRLYTLDISDPSNIAVLSTFQGYYRSATVSSDETKVFAAMPYNGLGIYDISDPTNITLLGTYDTPGNAKSVTLSKDENIAFVSDYNGQLQIINVSDPGNPTLLSTFDSSGFKYNIESVLSSDGNTLYVVNLFYLDIFDVSNPSSPQLLGSTKTQRDQYGNRVDGFSSSIVLSTDGKVAYVESASYGLIVLDISDSTAPSVMGHLDLDLRNSRSVDGYGPGKLTLSPDETTIYLAGDKADLKVIDVRRPSNPVLIETHPTISNSYGVTTSVAGDMLYISGYPRYDTYAGVQLSGPALEILDIKKKAVAVGDIVKPYLYFASAADASGNEQLNFRVNDGALDSNEATVSVLITGSINNDGTWTYTENSDDTLTITGCVGLCPSDLVIPEQINGSPVIGVSNHAFANSGITSVKLPDTMIKIANYAFYKNSLKLLTLGSNVTDIGAGSFSYNNIAMVSFLGNRPGIEVNAFKANRELEAIGYCPDKSDWPGAGISNGLSAIIPIEKCAYEASFAKITLAAANSDITNLTIADLDAVSILNEISPSNLDQYLTFIKLSSLIENVADIQRIISSVNSVMASCPSSAYFVSVAGSSSRPSQISWALMGDDPDISLLSGSASYLLFTCLADGRYTLNMYDSFGDGWVNYYGEADTFFSIMSGDGIEPVSYTHLTLPTMRTV